MKKYILSNTCKALAVSLNLAASMLFVTSCNDDQAPVIQQDHNFVMNFETRAATTAELIQNMQLYTFYRNNGGSNDQTFHRKILNMVRTDNQITAQVETGHWYMAMVSPPQGVSIIEPVAGATMDKLPMYKYVPEYDDTEKRHKSASEIFFINKDIPEIKADESATTGANPGRNIARVQLVLKKVTSNFELASGNHEIILDNVPSTISYTGALLPERDAPALVEGGLKANVTLKTSTTDPGFLCADPIIFDIPAHRGDCDADDPQDITTKKMSLTVKLQRAGGGSIFVKEDIEIDKVAICNHVLQVNITVNDGVLFESSIEKWEEVNLGGTIGAEYENWLYVKSGVDGTGQSWSDAAPDINTAITRAGILKAAGKTVHGILVATGEDNTTLIYNEGLTIPTDIRIFGGWEGKAGTELAANDANAPYTSDNRKLATKKARLNTGASNVTLANGSVLDGFIISGSGSGSALVTLNQANAWINAVEIDQQTVSATYAVSIINGSATNVLVSRNNKGVSVTGNGKLVNATIANNTAPSVLSGTVLSTIYWANSGTPTTSASINYCAFNGTVPAGTNYPINVQNKAWMTETPIPGPHFNQEEEPFVPYYAVNTTTPNRAPHLGRGHQESFDQATPSMPAEHKKDIDGNPRHHNGTDIGCYESTGTQKGFEFRWNMKDIYISPKVSIESDHPALLFDNTENVVVSWQIEVININSNRFSLVSTHTSGSGNTVNLGYFRLKSGTSTNTGNADLDCGTVRLKCTNLDKAYFPDTEMKVFQSPATPKVWTNGYAGSFHKWNETEARYIFGTNSGPWIARIISGHEWIKIDGKPRPADPYNDTQVEETFGGFVEGDGDIVFRVGMKSKLANADSNPRYGLISITRRGSDGRMGAALFFVRQGEKADYLYGPKDERPLGARAGAIKFSPYNLTDPQGRFIANGAQLGKKGGGFVDYPSKTGYHFKWNDTRAYYPDNTRQGTNLDTSSRSTWSDDYEPCPEDYFTPSETQFVHSYFLNRDINESGSGNAVGTTFVWGRLADGYYDKLAGKDARYVGSGPDRAVEGLLMYNDYTNASVFFPMAGCRTADAGGGLNKWKWNNGWTETEFIQWTLTRDTRPNLTSGQNASNYRMWHTHSYGEGETGHLGLSCTQLKRYDAMSVRCVKPADPADF